MKAEAHEPDVDLDWDELASNWRSEDEASAAPIDPAIHHKVRRQSWWMAAAVVFETVLSLGAMGYGIWQAYRDPTAASYALALALGVIVVGLWSFSMWTRRGTWRPSARSTRAFVEFSLLRAERKLLVLRSLPYLVMIELALLLPPVVWMVQSDPERWARFQETYLLRFAFIGLFLLTVGIFTWWRRGKILQEMKELEILRGEFEEG